MFYILSDMELNLIFKVNNKHTFAGISHQKLEYISFS
jgi:hypothetical protein